MKKWDELADGESIERAKAALEADNIAVTVVETSAEARAKFFELLPAGASVMNMTSQTLIETGILDELTKSGGYQLIKEGLKTLDPKKDHRKKQQLGAAPEWAVGSLHAITQDGHLMWASQTGSQLAAYAYGADHIILVASTKKIVADTAEGMRRIYEYCLPLEAERAKVAYGAAGSAVNRILILNAEREPGRTHLILVNELLGF